MSRFIIDSDLSSKIRYCVPKANTVENLRTYLDSNPRPEYRLVSVINNSGDYLLIWEKK